jgi:SAM-dependent methyltransferase
MAQFHTWLFNRIAYFYQFFYRKQVKEYAKILSLYEQELKLPKSAKILDVGCGTGAFGAAFKQRGYEVVGIDIAKKMVKKGRKNQLICEEGDILNGLSFDKDKFDLVIMGSVLHGVNADSRRIIFQETSRLTKQKVLFHDYHTTRKWYISFIEWIEHGDYFNFIKNLPTEFEDNFDSVKIFDVSTTSAWYLCRNSSGSENFKEK